MISDPWFYLAAVPAGWSPASPRAVTAPGPAFWGIWLHNRVPNGLFYNASYVFLALTGVKLTWDGLAGAALH